MKIRMGFVSNSSTSSFVFTNTSKFDMPLQQLIIEILNDVMKYIYKNNNELYDEFYETFDEQVTSLCKGYISIHDDDYTIKKYKLNDIIKPNESITLSFEHDGEGGSFAERYFCKFAHDNGLKGKTRNFVWNYDCDD